MLVKTKISLRNLVKKLERSKKILARDNLPKILMQKILMQKMLQFKLMLENRSPAQTLDDY